MYEPLRDLSQDLLLPGLENVPPDTVLGLETNRRFVEAYMVGLNVEMGRELLWRGFPTNQRGTYFDQFWGGGAGHQAAPHVGRPAARRCAQLGAAREFRHAAAQRAAAPLSQCADLPCSRRQRPGDQQARPERGRGQREAAGVRGVVQPDINFFGFDVTPDQAVGSDRPIPATTS